MQITITIGQNVKNVPMSQKLWFNYKQKILGLFSELFVNAEYAGQWDGIDEVSNIFLGETLPEYSLIDLESILGALAAEYNQDAIGLLVNSRKTSLVFKAI